MALVADGSRAAEVAVRPDLAVRADDRVALDVNTRQNPRARPEVDDAFDDGVRMDLTLDLRFGQRADVQFIRPQEVPRVDDEERRRGKQRVVGIRRIAQPRERPTDRVDQGAMGIRRQTGKVYRSHPGMGMNPQPPDGKRGVVIAEQDVPDRKVLDGAGGEEWHGGWIRQRFEPRHHAKGREI